MRFDLRRIKVQRVRIDVEQHWARPGAQDGAGGREAAECRGDDAVARAGADGQQGEPESVRPGGAADGLRASYERRDFAFERFDLGPQDEVLRSAHALD